MNKFQVEFETTQQRCGLLQMSLMQMFKSGKSLNGIRKDFPRTGSLGGLVTTEVKAFGKGLVVSKNGIHWYLKWPFFNLCFHSI